MLKQFIQKFFMCQPNPKLCQNSAYFAIPARFLTLGHQKFSLSKQKVQQTPVASPAASGMISNVDEIITVSRPCTVYDRDDMINFMSEFFATREPLMKSLGANPRNSRKYISYCIDVSIKLHLITLFV